MSIQIFDRSREVARRLAELIKESGIEMPVHTSDTYAGSVSLLHQMKAKYVLLDLNFPGNLSCTLVRLIKNSNPGCIVIVLYTHEDKLKINQCLEHGADYLFNKYDEFEKIPDVIDNNK